MYTADTLSLFIDNAIIEAIVKFTNIEGKRERGQKWKEPDVTEMKAFIGCLHQTSALKQNDLSLERLFKPVDGSPLVRAVFGLKRFSSFLNHIRFDDKMTRSFRRARDAFAPIRDLWDAFHASLGRYYHAGPNITIDEQLVNFGVAASSYNTCHQNPISMGSKYSGHVTLILFTH